MRTAGSLYKTRARLKKEKEGNISSLLKEIPKLEKRHKQNPIPENLIELSDKRIELQRLLNEQTLRLRDESRPLFYQRENKPGRLLARALSQRASMTSIVKIKTTSGELTHDPEGILKSFHSFYSKLYNTPNQQAVEDPETFRQDVRQYIHETAIPSLSATEREELEKEFSVMKLQNVIDSMVLGKSPGPEGFTPRFLRTIRELLIPIMIRTFNAISVS